MISVALRNIGKNDLFIEWSGPEGDYAVELTTANNEAVALTERGRNMLMRPPKDGSFHPRVWSTQTFTLRPSEERMEGIRLDILFVLPEDGGVVKARVGRRLEYLNEEKHAIETTTLWCNPMTLQMSSIKK